MIKELAIKHPYYCSESSYWHDDHDPNNPQQTYENLGRFLEAFEDADIDLNLVFRWDIKPYNEDDLRQGYYAEVFMILQRKGIFKPIRIVDVEEENLSRFVEYLSKHWLNLQEIWNPIPSYYQ